VIQKIKNKTNNYKTKTET